MSDRRISIVHVSDVHFDFSDSDESQNVIARSIADGIQESIQIKVASGVVAPSYLVVTGDLISGVPSVLRKELSQSISELSQLIIGGNLKNIQKLTVDPKLQNEFSRYITNQHQQAIKWIIKLANSIQIDTNNVFVVPGNHDVNWAKMGGWANQISACLSVAMSPHVVPPEKLSEINKVISRNYGFVQKAFIGNSEKLASMVTSSLGEYLQELRNSELKHCATNDAGIYRIARNENNVPIVFCGLNTAWSCSYQTNHLPAIPTAIVQQLAWLRDKKTTHACADNVDSTYGSTEAIQVALAHHPVSWAHTLERADIRNQIINNFDVLLRGHEHVEYVQPTGVAHTEISAAATHGNGDSSGFSILEIDHLTAKGRAFLYKYNIEKSEYELRRPKHCSDDGAMAFAITRANVDNKNLNSTAMMRRVGFSSGNISFIEEIEATVLTIDIEHWSALSADQQAKVLNELWSSAERASARASVDARLVGFSPISDGIIVAIAGELDLAARACLIVAKDIHGKVTTLVRSLLKKDGEPLARFGIHHGMVSVATEGASGGVLLYGKTVNLSRRLAYSSDPGFMLVEINIGVVLSELITENDELDSLEIVIPQRGDEHHGEILPLLWQRNVTPMQCVAVRMAPRAPQPDNIQRNINIQKNIRSLSQGMLQSLLDEMREKDNLVFEVGIGAQLWKRGVPTTWAILWANRIWLQYTNQSPEFQDMGDGWSYAILETSSVSMAAGNTRQDRVSFVCLKPSDGGDEFDECCLVISLSQISTDAEKDTKKPNSDKIASIIEAKYSLHVSKLPVAKQYFDKIRYLFNNISRINV